MVRNRLGRSELFVSPIGFGTFKIGRNTGIKYPEGYPLPDDEHAQRLIDGILDLGINYIDTAPAYGVSEQRLGKLLRGRREDVVISTKVGETYRDGVSTYDFSGSAVRESVNTSLRHLVTDYLDIVYIHSDGRDLEILQQTDIIATLTALKQQGVIRAIGLSGKTVEGAEASLSWADVVMVEYHLNDATHQPVIAKAAENDVGVVVKKGIGSGHLSPGEAIRYVLKNPGVGSLVVGGLNLDHIRDNVKIARSVRPETRE